MRRQIKEVLVMKTFLNIALATGLLTLAVGNLAMHSEPPNYQHQAERPSQIVRLTPEEKARAVNSDATVSVRFELLRGSHPILLPSLKLIVDGVDVTEQARIAATDDIPPSQGEISFNPERPLSPGKHTAEVGFSNDKNQQYSYSWEFDVSK
jgi:hypothetical protein